MNIWLPLDRIRAHDFFHLPLALIQNPANAIYIPQLYDYEIDGPWPLVFFLRDAERAATFQIRLCTVYEETLEHSSNPLQWETGHLHLDRVRTLALSGLVRIQSRLTRPRPGRAVDSAFQQITDTEARTFRFDPDLLWETVQHYYLVRHLTPDHSSTILYWSYRQDPPQRNIGLRIIEVTPEQRLDQTWMAEDHATGVLTLDQEMGYEFADMLEAYAHVLDE